MATSARAPLKVALLVATAAVSCANGTFYSPVFDSVFFHMGPVADSLFIHNPRMRLYLTGVMLALMTFVLAGVPAALYERALRLNRSSITSLLVWFASAVILASPTLLVLLRRE